MKAKWLNRRIVAVLLIAWSLIPSLLTHASSSRIGEAAQPNATPPGFQVYLPVSMAGIPQGSMWISPAEIAGLPTSGPAWQNLMKGAGRNTSAPQISDPDDNTDVYVLAKALVYARTGDPHYRNEVVASLMAAIGSEGGPGTGILPVARNIQSYVIAADLIKLAANHAENAAFRTWLSTLRYRTFDDDNEISIVICHEKRANNIGTHCGAARIAIALYLGDEVDLARAATVFKGWLGDRSAYAGFRYGDLWWQCDPARPVGINPAGCIRDGYSIDGVLPDDQRRGGPFSWPPPKENYAWGGLQGAVVQAELLSRAGYPAWEWQDHALLRAVRWLYEQAQHPAVGDDGWQPWIINHAYGTSFAAPTPSGTGKGMAWTDWTHSR